MPKSLGIYVENNLIKYAKVSKEHDDIKVETYGVRAFENISDEIKRIIEETFSFNTPICINLANEKYVYFDFTTLLNKKDIPKIIETEFETYCEEKNFTKNVFETRYVLTQELEDKEKIKVIDIASNKIDLNRQMQPFENYKLTKVVPLPMTIAKIADIDKNENVLILNMEETATITSIIEQQIYDVKTLDLGSKEVLEKINQVENSYGKAYDICKNTTIYTAEMESIDEQQHLQYILPTIYSIREELQQILLDSSTKYSKVYLTGTLALVNNVDLYFQEILTNIECIILKPKFVQETSTQINIKDYIEVNSAIALAISEFDDDKQTLNFKKVGLSDKLSQLLKTDSKNKGTQKEISIGKNNIKLDMDLGGKLDNTEWWLVRTIAALVFIIIIFSVFSSILSKQMNDKINEIEGSIAKEESIIAEVDAQKESLDSKNDKYNSLIKKMEEMDQKNNERLARKNAIPYLLNDLKVYIPNKVQLVSIDNTENKHIVIVAQSEKYEQLGYFIAKIKTEKILRKVVSSSSIKNGDVVTVTIEGELR